MINIEDFDIQAEISNKTLDSNTAKCQQQSINNNLSENKTNDQYIQNQSLSNSYDKRNSIQQQEEEEIQCHLQNEDATIQKKNKKKQVECLNTPLNLVKTDNSITSQVSNNCQVNYVYEDTENETNQQKNIEEQELRNKIDQIFNKAKNSQSFDSWKYTVYNELLKKSYIIESYINSGGQACVFDGYYLNDKGIKCSCAFKIYFQVSNEEFQKEINIMRSFENPINIIKVIDSFQIESQFILVLEKCEKSLQDELKQIKEQKVNFSNDKLLQMIFDLLDGLIQFRIYNILHLDIKPGNILISKDSNYCYSDFGTSFNKKQNEEIEVEYYTKKYAAPEQKENLKSIDYQADVYSLGITFQVILDIFKKESQYYKENKHNIKDFITDFEEIIKNNMILQKSSERLQCQKLHELILQKVFVQIKNQKFNINYCQKVLKISQLYPYSQNKDIPYFLQMKIFYQQTNLSLLRYVFDNFGQFKSTCESSFGNPYENQKCILESIDNIKDHIQNQYSESEFNMKKYYDIKEQIQNNSNASEVIQNTKAIIKDFYKLKQICEGDKLSRIGKTYFDVGDYKNALKYSLQSLELNKSIHQGNHKDIAYDLTFICSCYQMLGENEIGLEYQLESLDMRQQIFKGNNDDIAESFNNIGNSYLNKGNYQTGLRYLLKSLEMRKQIFLTNHSYIAITLGNIGQAYEYLGDNQNSLNFQLQSFLMFKSVLSGNHPDIGNCLNNLGICYVNIGNIEKGMKYEQKSLKLKKEVFQGANSDIATSLNNIGATYMSNNDYVNGLKYSLQALEMRKQFFQGIHQDIPVSLNNVAICYDQLGDKKNSLKYYQESLQMFKQIYKGNHPNIGRALMNLGKFYKEIGDAQSSLKYFQEYIKMNQGQQQNTQILNFVGECYQNLGDFQNSIKYRLESLKIKEQTYKGKHPIIAQQMHEIGMCYYHFNDFANSWKYLISSEDMNKQFIQGFNKSQCECLQTLSMISKNFFKDFQKCFIYAFELLQYLKQYTFIDQDISVAAWLNNMCVFCIELGDFKNGLKYSQECLVLRKKIFKGNQISIAASLHNSSICFGRLGFYKQYIKYKTKSEEMQKQLKQYS